MNALALLFLSLACAAPSTPPSPAPTPAPAFRWDTYRLEAVEPAAPPDEEESRRHRHASTARPRALRLKFARATRAQDLRGAITFVPEVEIDWRKADNIGDDAVQIVGAFEREKAYELIITG